MNDGQQELKRVLEEWAAAEQRGDTAFLERTLADDYIGVGPRGFTLTKEQWLDRHEAGSLRYESFGLDEVEVRPYGDAAVTVCQPECRGSLRGRERSLRHPRAIPRDARLREAARALAAGGPATEPHPG